MKMKFEDWLKRRRIMQGLTQKQIAEKIGISEVSYCLIETGKQTPSITTTDKIARYFHVKPESVRRLIANKIIRGKETE